MKTSSLVLLTMGSLLILAGVAQVFVQMMKRQRFYTERRSGDQAVTVSAREIRIQTAYPGISMIGIGAVLLALGAWTSN